MTWLEENIYPFFLEWDQYLARKSSTNNENYYKKLQSPDELKFKWLIDFFKEKRFTIPADSWLVYEPGVDKNKSYVVVPRSLVQQELKSSNQESKPPAVTSEKKSETSDDEENCCKICFDAEIQVAIVPCGHTCLCTKCSGTLKQCPICRNNIQSCLKLYKS